VRGERSERGGEGEKKGRGEKGREGGTLPLRKFLYPPLNVAYLLVLQRVMMAPLALPMLLRLLNSLLLQYYYYYYY